jgi:UDP-3-O-[3-hydroxymyristoyl] glucosamine N-acyltransferase
MVKISPVSVADLKQAVRGTVVRGDEEGKITEIGEPREVGAGGVAFVFSESYLQQIPQTRASVLVIASAFADRARALIPETIDVCIECDDAYLGLAHFSKMLATADPIFDWPSGKISNTAIHPTASVAPTAQIGPGVLIGERARIGAHTVVVGNAAIGPETKIGSSCVIFPGAVLYPRTVLGDRVRVHANAVVGSDGFGYAAGREGAVKIWHLGNVVVGNDVEIGAGTTIDRGTIKNTIIEDGAIIDNQVQIGHNGHVKAHAIICAQVGLAGNVTIGRGAVLAGACAVIDKASIGDGAQVGAMSGISKSVKPGEKMMGTVRARPLREWHRLAALFERLPELFERIKNAEARLDGRSRGAGPPS